MAEPGGRIELVWPGKYAAPGRRRAPPRDAPPLRLVERLAPSAGTDPVVPVEPSPPNGWHNRLVQGDNLAVMATLLPELEGQVDLLYIDPPFATGGTVRQGPYAFADQWADGGAAYLAMLDDRLQLIRDLLAPNGSLFVHCDPRMDWAVRCLLDELFGPDRLVNQIVWHYTGGGRSKRYFSRKHDILLWVAKSDTWTFNIDAVRQPYVPTSGFARGGIRARSGKRYLPHPGGTPADDVWAIPIINPRSSERLGYPTQKPERLLERVIAAASQPGDLVADVFCGSGTTLAVAERLGRRWLGCDVSADAVRLTRDRLSANPDCRPFEILAVDALVSGPPAGQS
jgi:site-specific DNA-methyltransferase (adenine-specific)